MSFNAVGAILNADKVWPEPLSLPDALEGADPVTLAEARSRLAQIGQIARELVKLVDQELAGSLEHSALRYGNDVYRPSNGRGSAKVTDPESWWGFVSETLGMLNDPDRAALLNALYPASSLRLTALAKLAAATVDDLDPGVIRDTFIAYDPPTSLLSVMPIQKAPKFLQDLEDGEIREIV
jgi:hypothetical protein